MHPDRRANVVCSHTRRTEICVLEKEAIPTPSLIRTQAETLPIVAVWIAGDGYAH
jgi:hypothetical protein